MSATTIAEKLRQATVDATARGKITDEFPGLTVADAYVAQGAALEMALGRGEKLVGYKMGLTSRAKQRDVNVHEPIRGFLLSSMEYRPGQDVETKTRIQPRAEPEIAVVMKARLHGPRLTMREVVAAIGSVHLALEILDSRFEKYQFTLPDVVADNTSASGFIVGSKNYLPVLDRVRLMGVTLRKNGEIVDTGAPAAVLGDPLVSVATLAEKVPLEPGMVILTGGICAAAPFTAGDWIEVHCGEETVGFRAI